MKFKKIMSLALALIMATALCVPALASAASADSSSMTQTSDLTGTTEVGKIDLTVTSPGGLVFNPSKIYVKVANATGTVNENATDNFTQVSDQIIVPTIKITNKTNVPLNMTATVGIKVDGGANVVAVAPQDNQTAKQIMLTADFAVFDGDIYADSSPATIREDSWLTASKLIATAATQASDGKVTGGKTHTPQQAVRIPATLKGANGIVPNYVYVKFGGAATKVPTTPWAATDKFDVYTVYQFQPQSTPEKRILVATKPSTATNPAQATYATYANLDAADAQNGQNGQSAVRGPVLYVSYGAAALTVTKGDNSMFKNLPSGANEATYITTNDVWPGYTVIIKPTESATAGKYYAITAVTFLNEDGTPNNTRAAKVGNKSDAYWTFVMPDANVQCIITYGTTAT